MYELRHYFAGDIVEVEFMHTKKCPPKGVRATRTKPTPEDVKKYNEKIAEDYLRRKFHCNFYENDLHIVLGYPQKYRPKNEQIKKDLKAFKKAMRKEYKKLELPFKYMHVTGFYDKDGMPDSEYNEHDETTVHHHMVMNSIDYRIITAEWKKIGGRVWFYPLDDEGDYTALVTYLIGHTKNLFREKASPTKKRWSCSRNLKDPPPPKTKVVHAATWRKDPKAIKGYKLITDSIKRDVSNITGYPYMFYRMVKIKQQRK